MRDLNQITILVEKKLVAEEYYEFSDSDTRTNSD